MSTDSLSHKKYKASARCHRTRGKMTGTAQRPRLSVHIGNRNISAQIINDEEGKTLAYATTVNRNEKATMSDNAAWLGDAIAKSAKAAKVKKVVLDRGSAKFHGRIKQLAEAARKGGLEF